MSYSVKIMGAFDNSSGEVDSEFLPHDKTELDREFMKHSNILFSFLDVTLLGTGLYALSIEMRLSH